MSAMTLARAVREAKASCHMTSLGQPGRYVLMYGDDGPTPIEGSYRVIHGFCLRYRVRKALKLWRPRATDREISHAVGRAYYDHGARSFDKALGHALASLNSLGTYGND